MNALYLLTDAGSNATTNPLNNILSFLPMVLIIGAMVVFMFISSRKQRKQEKEIADMRNNIAVGDEITTIGGIIGKVVSIKEETLVLETSHDRTRIRILKTAVSRVDVKAEDAQN